MLLNREVTIEMSNHTYIGITRSKSNNELKHWKYLKKVKKNGKWRYYYDMESLKEDFKDKFDDIYNDPENIYDVDASNYDKKIEQIKKSKEWKDIVKREDPEYVKKNKDGTKTYYIDDYLVKKKHPELDIISDLGAGRKISLNKVSSKSFLAGAKDYIKTGQTVVALAAGALTEKIKFQQGTYSEEVNKAKSGVSKSYNSSKKTYESAKKNYKSTTNKAKDTYSKNSIDSNEIDDTIDRGAMYLKYVLGSHH